MIAQAQTETAAPTKTPTLTRTPTRTPTPASTATRRPTATTLPTATPSCDLTETIRAVKAAIPYKESAVHFTNIAGTASLGVWIVDPDLNPNPPAEKLPAELEKAKFHAALVSAQVKAASPCAGKLFGVINPIVVDKKYQGWFSGQIRPIYLPDGPEFSDSQISNAVDMFQVGYFRSALKYSYKRGACGWPETRDRLQMQFSPDRELVTFYFVIDEMGSNVYIQWDGPADPIFAMANLGNVFIGLECFSPTANVIFMIVNENGVAQQIGDIPQGDTSQLTIVYP
jgi:hypothetical protein